MFKSSEIDKLHEEMAEELDGKRFWHTIGVAHTAASLAMRYNVDMDTAYVTGLLHDCAKCMSHEERLSLCNEYDISVTESELENKALLHAKAGAILAKIEYDITDEDILHAISVHTTGEPDMNLLDKIIYIADYIEPGRDKAPNLEFVRKIAYKDLDACMAQILYDTLNYLQMRGGTIDPTTELTYQYYRKYRKERD